MKINIIGGGPAGLYFAVLAKKLDRGNEVALFDRSKPWEETDGRGTLFNDSSFYYLADSDQPTHDAVAREAHEAGEVYAAIGERKVAVRAGRTAAVGRRALLEILRARARELEVDMQFGTELTEPDRYRDCDLLVGADGAESRVRSTYRDQLQPSVEWRQTRFWRLGTSATFPGPTWILEERDGGRFLAHAWQFERDRSSFIVECHEDTWRRSGLAEKSAEGLVLVSELFARDLRGHALSFEPRESWTASRVIDVRHQVHENVVLLGNAARTAHFAFDGGFRRALEDASGLANALRARPEVVAALELFETERRSELDRAQRAAAASSAWLEDLLAGAATHPVSLAYQLATRTQNLARGDLQRLDPAFVSEYEAFQSREKTRA